MTPMKILITGGTGALGRRVADAAERSGLAVRVGSRRAPGGGAPAGREWARMDLASGEGVREAVAGVDAVVHAASDPRRADVVDVAGTRRLVEAARAAGAPHLVYVSIVGVDRIPLGYYRRKLAAERIVEGAGLAFSILRATQFHGLVERLLSGAARVPLRIPLPTDFRVQSVDPSEVAERLVQVVEAGPAGRLPDLAGPETLTLAEAAAQWKEVRGIRKRVVRLPLPGAAAAAFRAGHNTAPEGERATVSWRSWLHQGAAPRARGAG